MLGILPQYIQQVGAFVYGKFENCGMSVAVYSKEIESSYLHSLESL